MEETQNDTKRQTGFVYRIIALKDDFKDEEQYIGSTFQRLSKRLSGHKTDYNRYLNQKFQYVTSFSLFEKFGVDNCKIVLIEQLENVSKKELQKREYELIIKSKCCNKKGKFDKKQYQEQYRQENKKQTIQYSEQYRKEHKEKIREYLEQYRHENKEQLKQYREQNKEKMQHQQSCECRGHYTTANKSTHFKSKKHQQYEETKTGQMGQ